MKKSTTEITQSICQRVTDKLVSLMEAGVNPWEKPWSIYGEDNAISHTNGKPYSLLNQIMLGFRSGEYLTFNQVKAEGGSVKKGAKSEMIVFWQSGGLRRVVKPKDDNSPTSEEEEEESEDVWVEFGKPILRHYNVFHIDDCEGITPKFPKSEEGLVLHPVNPIEQAEEVAEDYCQRTGVKLMIKESNSAFYQPSTDSVTVPLREQFDGIAEFYSTLYHELTHSTGHASRLNRFDNGMFVSRDKYSREELIAEIGAATAMSILGINSSKTDSNSAAYLANWASFLKSDPKAIIVAAGRAEKAINLIFNK